jgi:hypothetical protein
MSATREPFLDRWSRLKSKDREAAKEVEQETAVAPPANAEAPPALPEVENLTPQSDFRPFMGSGVDPLTRRAALKKLFGDAHFNLPDPFEPYSIDLTGEDPIPAEMLKTLHQAQKLLFDEPEKTAQAPTEPPRTEEPEVPLGEAKDGAGRADA